MDEIGFVAMWMAILVGSVVLVLLVAFFAARLALSYLGKTFEQEPRGPSTQSWED